MKLFFLSFLFFFCFFFSWAWCGIIVSKNGSLSFNSSPKLKLNGDFEVSSHSSVFSDLEQLSDKLEQLRIFDILQYDKYEYQWVQQLVREIVLARFKFFGHKKDMFFGYTLYNTANTRGNFTLYKNNLQSGLFEKIYEKVEDDDGFTQSIVNFVIDDEVHFVRCNNRRKFYAFRWNTDTQSLVEQVIPAQLGEKSGVFCEPEPGFRFLLGGAHYAYVWEGDKFSDRGVTVFQQSAPPKRVQQAECFRGFNGDYHLLYVPEGSPPEMHFATWNPSTQQFEDEKTFFLGGEGYIADFFFTYWIENNQIYVLAPYEQRFKMLVGKWNGNDWEIVQVIPMDSEGIDFLEWAPLTLANVQIAGQRFFFVPITNIVFKKLHQKVFRWDSRLQEMVEFDDQYMFNELKGFSVFDDGERIWLGTFQRRDIGLQYFAVPPDERQGIRIFALPPYN